MAKREKGSKLPTVAKALQAVAAQAGSEDKAVHRITIRLLESGEVTYRLHSRDEDLYEGGVITVG